MEIRCRRAQFVQKTKVNNERLLVKLLNGCGSMDKIISCHQLFLMKNKGSKKVVCFILVYGLQSLLHTLHAFL